MSYVPADALAIGEIDLAALSKTRFARKILADASVADALRDACGADVPSQVRRVTIVVPKREPVEFGIAVEGSLAEGPLVECAGRRARDRGSSLGSADRAGALLHFDRDSPQGALAFPAPGLVLWGHRRALGEMIETAKGKHERMPADAEHMRLRDRIGKGRQAWFAARVPASVRQAWSDEAPDDLRPFVEVSWIVAGLRLGDGVQISAIVRATSEPAAARMERIAQRLLRKARLEPVFQLSAFGPVVERLQVSRERSEIVLSLSVSERQIDAIADSLADLERALRPETEGTGDGKQETGNRR